MRVIISGAAGVLGEAERAGLLRAGVTVSRIASDRDGEDVAGAAWFACETLADEPGSRASADKAITSMGRIDALAPVVGAVKWRKLQDCSVADRHSLFAANVEKTLSMVKTRLPSRAQGGAIVAVGAASAEPAGPGLAAYGAANSSGAPRRSAGTRIGTARNQSQCGASIDHRNTPEPNRHA